MVGAADESDWDIFQRMDQLYTDWNLKRIYYAAFRPVSHTPLEEHPPTLMAREHRLYQLDWLKRIYHFSNQELKLAFNNNGFLPLEADPKTVIAAGNLDTFPIEVNLATREQLLRVPGVGPTSAQRILQTRRRHTVDTWQDLQAMGVIRKQAGPFLVFPGYRPASAKQLRLDLFAEGPSSRHAQQSQTSPGEAAFVGSGQGPSSGSGGSGQAVAPCGLTTSCVGCSMYGMPGHPGG